MDPGDNKDKSLLDLLEEQQKKEAPEAPEAAEPPKPEVPEAELPKVEVPKPEAPEAELPKAEAPKMEPPKVEPPQPGTVPPAQPQPRAVPPEPPKPEPPKAEPEQPGPSRVELTPSRTQAKRMAKAQAREELRELKRQIKEEKRQQKARRLQEKLEERRKFPTWSLRHKAQRLRWKKEKAERRQALKDRYRDAPWIVRVWRLYLMKPVIALLILALVAGGVALVANDSIGPLLSSYLETSKNLPVEKDQIYELSPIDKDGEKRIDAVAPVDKDDTWTISVYIVGSNLEDMDENDLSQVIRTQVADIQQQTAADSAMAYKKRLNNFSDELNRNDLEIPAYLYYPNKPVETDTNEEEENGPVIAKEPGAASVDIGEMTSDTWSDNINIVIQTGGATRWSNERVNPNRTQRFAYQKGVFRQVDDQPLQPAADPKTLTDFLKFSKNNYPADHNMLVLWNHGGGAFGYGVDSIYGGMMSLKDLRKALEGAYEPNEKEPAFDVIGFDACLMSSLEAVHALNGFASYFAVSEETEPGEGWDYGPWLEAMTKDPTMSPAKVAQNIADSYMDFYMTQNVNVGWLISNDVTFCVLDGSKTEELYKAWCDLTKQQLIDAATDSSVLSEIGRCSNKSTHFVSSVYNLYNTIDLGNYVDVMVDSYPKECSRIKKLIGETVMYHRENGSLSDSQGISVYMPGSVNDYAGLAYCLDYIYDICEDPSTQALYYYKIAGCLNEDMQEYLATLTENKAKTLNLRPFTQFSRTEPVITEDGFEIPLGENLQEMLESYELEAAVVDRDAGTITNYGRDETVRLDGDGNADCEFDGTWICYDGVPLAPEVVAATDSTVEYRAKVLYNGMESILSFTWDRETEEFTLNGVRGASDLTGLISTDPFNYLINSRMNTEVKKGDEIIPVYDITYLPEVNEKDRTEKDKHGDKIKVSKRSKITNDKLPSGYYITSAVISDPRGDVYYSPVVGNDVSGGKVKSRKADPDFAGRDY